MVDRDMTFRDAQASDAADLARIGRDTFVETFGHLYPPSDLKAYLDDTYSLDAMTDDLKNPEIDVRIALTGKRIAAYCKIGPTKLPIDTGPDPSLELHRVYVYEAHQGIGVGRILLTWAIERARQRGAKNLFLGVWEANERAISVYESRGFQKVGSYIFHVGESRDNEHIMRLRLT